MPEAPVILPRVNSTAAAGLDGGLVTTKSKLKVPFVSAVGDVIEKLDGLISTPKAIVDKMIQMRDAVKANFITFLRFKNSLIIA
jgi:hypothetical protein